MQLSLRNKIILCYTILIAVSISISLLIFFLSRDYITNKAVQEIALESIEADNRAFDAMLHDVLDTSKTIIASQLVQDALNRYTWEADSKAMSYFKELISFKTIISSAYIFREDGIRYYSDKRILKSFSYNDIVNLPIYKKILEKNGGYVVALNSGGLIKEDTEYISFMRLVKSLRTFKPIGLLCINVEFNKMFNLDKKNVAIIEAKDDIFVIENNVDNVLQNQMIEDMFNGNYKFSRILYHGISNYVIVGIKNEGLNMKFIRCIPVHEISVPISAFTMLLIIIIAISILLIFFGSIWISNFISRPIKNLIESMEGVYNGNFNFSSAINTKDEIGHLQDVYNITIDKIQKLINDIYEEQNALRRAELEITMAQIKPHFLYNTLNSISSLAIIGKTKEVSETINALGNFYKSCLNNGKEIISLEKELQSIRSYQYIQQLRYMDLFDIEYDIKEDALSVNIPKMILQPLVENSIYHGIRGNITDGLIKIKAYVDDDYLYIRVTDNGKGMTKEKLNEVLNGDSVGLNSTRKRILIMCGESSEFKIESTLNEGTCVSIKIYRRF